MQRRETVELVQDNVGDSVALQFYHDAVAIAVGLVAHVGNAFNALVAHQFRHLLDHQLLVHLIGNFRDDNRFAVSLELFDMHPAAHDDGAASGRVGGMDAGPAQHNAAGRKIRPGNMLKHFRELNLGLFDQRQTAVDDFAEIMRGNVRRHADGDAASAIDQKVRELRRQDFRLGRRGIVILLEINRFLVDIFE